jgi:prolyl-tRNA editing enzyme YbaK/EbsC (Cys-tRNA(Pro) deacylase)
LNAGSTRATLALGNLGVSFTLHIYGYDPRAERIGLQAPDAPGVEARRVLKTPMAEVDGKPVCVIHPGGSRSQHEKARHCIPRQHRKDRSSRHWRCKRGGTCEHRARAWSQCINVIDACSKSVSGP